MAKETHSLPPSVPATEVHGEAPAERTARLRTEIGNTLGLTPKEAEALLTPRVMAGFQNYWKEKGLDSTLPHTTPDQPEPEAPRIVLAMDSDIPSLQQTDEAMRKALIEQKGYGEGFLSALPRDELVITYRIAFGLNDSSRPSQAPAEASGSIPSLPPRADGTKIDKNS